MATLALTKIHLTLFFIFSLVHCINSKLTFMNLVCYSDETKNDSDYKANLDKAVARHTLEASLYSYYSINTTGVGPNKITTIYSCRYDISPRTCYNCVKSMANRISSCLPTPHGFIIYEECNMFYTNRSTSTIMDTLPGYLTYTNETYNLDEVHFSNFWNKSMFDVINNVVSDFEVSSSHHFAAISTKYQSKGTIYTYAQCNPDIAPSNCSRCLQNGFDKFAATNYSGSVYGQYFTPMCRLSYIFSTEELSRPWSFYLTFNRTDERLDLSAGNDGGRSNVGALIFSICSMAFSLKLNL